MATKDCKEGVGGGLPFYFNSKSEEEDLPSESDDNSDLSKIEWGEEREYGENADKEKKIKTAQVVFTMTWLDSVLDEINLLGSCTSTWRGGSPTPCMGPEWHSVSSMKPALLPVRCGMRGIGRGGISPSGTPMDSFPPVTTSLPPWRNILTLSG